MSKYQSLDDAILARVKNRWPLAPMTHALIMATSQVRDLAEAAVAGTSRPAFRAVDARLQALRKKGLIEYSNALGWSLRWPYCAIADHALAAAKGEQK